MEKQKPLLELMRDTQSEQYWKDNNGSKQPISKPSRLSQHRLGLDLLVVNCRFSKFLPGSFSATKIQNPTQTSVPLQLCYGAQPGDLAVFTILCPFGAAALAMKCLKWDPTTAASFMCEKSQELILFAVASLPRDTWSYCYSKHMFYAVPESPNINLHFIDISICFLWLWDSRYSFSWDRGLQDSQRDIPRRFWVEQHISLWCRRNWTR